MGVVSVETIERFLYGSVELRRCGRRAFIFLVILPFPKNRDFPFVFGEAIVEVSTIKDGKQWLLIFS